MKNSPVRQSFRKQQRTMLARGAAAAKWVYHHRMDILPKRAKEVLDFTTNLLLGIGGLAAWESPEWMCAAATAGAGLVGWRVAKTKDKVSRLDASEGPNWTVDATMKIADFAGRKMTETAARTMVGGIKHAAAYGAIGLAATGAFVVTRDLRIADWQKGVRDNMAAEVGNGENEAFKQDNKEFSSIASWRDMYFYQVDVVCKQRFPDGTVRATITENGDIHDALLKPKSPGTTTTEARDGKTLVFFYDRKEPTRSSAMPSGTSVPVPGC